MKKIHISLVLMLIIPLLSYGQSQKEKKSLHCYHEVVSYQINWNYNREIDSRNTGGIKLKMNNNESVTLKAKTPELLNVWLKILEQDPKKGKVYYFKKTDTEGVLLGNVLTPPSSDCK